MSHANTPPTVPRTIADEAGDTPNWVPALGFALFALIAVVFAVQYARLGSDAQPTAAEEPQPAQQAEPGE
jgi:hypothetical protein